MTVFLIIAALLMAGAMMFVLPSLLSKGNGDNQHVLRDEINLSVLRDQMRELDADLAAGTINAVGHESAKLELERRVAEDVQPKVAIAELIPSKPWTAIAVGLAIPAMTISLYFYLGSPAAFKPVDVAGAQEPAAAVTAEQIASMVSGLEQKLKVKPDDPDGWYMLARSFHALKKYPESADAYAKLVKLVPDNADLLADYADALAMAQNRSLQGEPEKIIGRALALDPKNLKALALAGSAAFDRRDFQAAATQWKKILLLVPPDSETARSIMSNIGEAQSLAGDSSTLPSSMPTQIAPVEADSGTAAGKNDVSVKGTVELDASLRSKVVDTDSVFIFARAADGPKFPLAVIRKQVKDLPMSFVLDDSMSMMPSAKLSNFPMVIVGARISKSGNATPSVGDFEGVTEAVKPGVTGLKIRISTERK
jgi:cytochrome c-type biogenesis protein CcmH